MMNNNTVTITFTIHEADFLAKQLNFLAENYTQGCGISRSAAEKFEQAIAGSHDTPTTRAMRSMAAAFRKWEK